MNNKYFLKKYCTKNNAFTLVELIVAIAILAILATISFFSLSWYSSNSRDSVRITDLDAMMKSLNLFNIDSWYYPEPSNPIDITYSWAVAWKQWTFWESVQKNVSKINKIPIDPLTLNEYPYSRTSSRLEYQVAAIFEWWISYNNINNNLFYTTNAEWKKWKINVNVNWNYNWKFVKVTSGNTTYILWAPSIITSEITSVDIFTVQNNKSYVYNNKTNLPAQYLNKWYTWTWWFDFSWNSNPLIFQWDINNLNNEYFKKIFIDNLKKFYENTILENESTYKEIVQSNIVTNSTWALNIVNTYLQNKVGWLP